MRGTAKLSIAALLICSSCSVPSQQAEEPPRPDTGGLLATISTEGDAGNCRFQWNDELISTDEIIDRGTAIIEAVVEAHNGAENLMETDIPYFRVEAAGALPYHCISRAIGAIREVGFPTGEFQVENSADPVFIEFEIATYDPPPDPMGQPRAVIALDDEGGIYVSGQSTNIEELPERARRALADKPVSANLVPIFDMIFLGPDYFVLPSARTRFDRVVETVRLLQRNDISINLVSCYLNGAEAEFVEQQIGEPLSEC